MSKSPQNITQLLNLRKENNSFRTLKTSYPSIDFSSNDYLGFSTQGILNKKLQSLENTIKTGSTGSRLISGNSNLFHEIENEVATFHQAEAALLFNSGYDANLGLLSSVPQKNDLILSDELIHASLIDGIRLSHATHYKFKHNDTQHLKDLIERHQAKHTSIFIVVESVYSMDGDSAPLIALANLAEMENVFLIVDEAHAIGVFGENGQGLCKVLNMQHKCFARIYTYGKAMGCHGAAVVGNKDLKNYLINFARSFIYTTAMPEHSLLSIKAAYQLLPNSSEIKKLHEVIAYFNFKTKDNTNFIKSDSAIHCIIISGNDAAQNMEDACAKNNVFVKSIKSPTVKETQERIRICLHAYNTKEEIDKLVIVLKSVFEN